MLTLTIIMFGGVSIFVGILIGLLFKREKDLDIRFNHINRSLDKIEEILYFSKKDNSIYSVYKDMEKIKKIMLKIFNSNNNAQVYREIDNIRAILSMYRKGHSVDLISKSLKLPKDEIETVIHFFLT